MIGVTVFEDLFLLQKEWSPLVLASRAGDLEIVQGIVELEAEIDKPTNVSEHLINHNNRLLLMFVLITETMDTIDVGCSRGSCKSGQVPTEIRSICGFS